VCVCVCKTYSAIKLFLTSELFYDTKLFFSLSSVVCNAPFSLVWFYCDLWSNRSARVKNI